MVECVSQKERKKGRKERKKEKSAKPVGFEPTPLAFRASALPPCYGRATMVGSGNEFLSNVRESDS